MKVLFDHQAFQLQTHGGVSRCFWELYKHLPEGVDAEICVKESNNAYLQLPNVCPIGYEYDHFITKRHWFGKGHIFEWYNKLRGCDYWHINKVKSIERLEKGEYDVFHPTFFDDYFLDHLHGLPFVLTIHDMIPERYPEFFCENDNQILMKRKLAPLADAIVAVSETTKQDILRFIDVPEEKIHVVYHGANFMKPTNDASLFSFEYILYVGDRFGYKRFKEWLPHLKPFLMKHPNVMVLCTGIAFNDEELQLMASLGIADRFCHHFVKDDQEFYSIYHHAVAFIYTSEYEGFGIPILEAYQANCPVLLNNASCFPEVAGDAAVFFNMNKEESDFAEQMERVYAFSDNERESLLKLQRERLEMYSWEKSARQLADVYERVCN